MTFFFFLLNITCFGPACLAHRVDLIALVATTLVAAGHVGADLTADVGLGTFINVCRQRDRRSNGKLRYRSIV